MGQSNKFVGIGKASKNDKILDRMPLKRAKVEQRETDACSY